MSTNVQNQPSLTGHAIAGALTTLISVPIVHPVYTVCTLLVTEKKVKNIVMPNNKIALRVLYRGTLANGACDLSGQVSVFWSYGYFRRLSQGNETLSGLGAAVTASPVYNLWDRIMIVQQANGQKMKQAMQTIRRKEGLRGFLKGNSWTILQESLYQPVFFSLSNQMAAKLNDKRSLPRAAIDGLCYLTSGLVVGAITSPLQYIRTLVYSDLGNRTARDLLRNIPTEKKWASLSQFSQVRIPLIGVNMAVAGLAKDFLLKRL